MEKIKIYVLVKEPTQRLINFFEISCISVKKLTAELECRRDVRSDGWESSG